MFLARFVGALRALVPLVSGASGLPYRRFWPWNAAASVLWVTAMVMLGAVFGEAIARSVDRFGVVISVVAVGGLIAWFVVRRRRRTGRGADVVPHDGGPVIE